MKSINHIPCWTPSPKSEQMERQLEKMFEFNRREKILSRECPTCGGDSIEFRDELSVKEFKISGMCQKCQDSVFGNL